ncbi:UNVERIFIED_CONTAM: hypothetical protein Slati_4406200 [Sesamum latifolium]|uniref:Uncharacterized protein n=1 Tax=Sesamum latifolium TaxID=2727402 RepID=A0AAW2SPC0_9LAMI
MRYKCEAFGRFKEYRLKVKNQTGRTIKALRLDRGGEYLSGEFIDYLKENGIPSQWTLLERHNLTEWLKAGIELCWTCLRKRFFVLRNAVFLEKGFPSDSQWDEVLLEESGEEPRHDNTTSFEPPVLTDSVSVLLRSTRESRVPQKSIFVGLTSQLDNDLKAYGEAMSDIDSDKWLEAMKSKMDSMGSNQVWILVDPPKGVRPVGF